MHPSTLAGFVAKRQTDKRPLLSTLSAEHEDFDPVSQGLESSNICDHTPHQEIPDLIILQGTCVYHDDINASSICTKFFLGSFKLAAGRVLLINHRKASRYICRGINIQSKHTLVEAAVSQM